MPAIGEVRRAGRLADPMIRDDPPYHPSPALEPAPQRQRASPPVRSRFDSLPDSPGKGDPADGSILSELDQERGQNTRKLVPTV